MQNSMWQACPVCNGQGINTLNQSCHVCNGHGIISVISGLPPQHNKTTTTTNTIFVPLNVDERRMDIIGQNGNEGLHYDETKYCALHDVTYDKNEYCYDCLEISNK